MTVTPVGSRFLAGVEGLEPPTPGFGDRCSDQLSYTPAAPRRARSLAGSSARMQAECRAIRRESSRAEGSLRDRDWPIERAGVRLGGRRINHLQRNRPTEVLYSIVFCRVRALDWDGRCGHETLACTGRPRGGQGTGGVTWQPSPSARSGPVIDDAASRRPWTSLRRPNVTFGAQCRRSLPAGAAGVAPLVADRADDRRDFVPVRSDRGAPSGEQPPGLVPSSCISPRRPGRRTVAMQKTAIDIPRARIGAGKIIRSTGAGGKPRCSGDSPRPHTRVHVDCGIR